MTRIIAGLAGSIHLTPPVKSTRPTADRIRESIFNRLENWEVLAGARVLDLFAGTGALGLEALSRGASSVVLVDSNKSAAGVCRANADLVGKSLLKQGVQFDVSVVPQDAKAFAHHVGETAGGFESAEFDLVFIDPPYDLDEKDLGSTLEHLVSHLAPDAEIVLECEIRPVERRAEAHRRVAQGVAGAVQAHHKAIADQIVTAHSIEIDQILEPNRFGRCGQRQGKKQSHPENASHRKKSTKFSRAIRAVRA